ncbi:2-oxoglutarate and iron-dependent oxygenase domain-containing protein 2-like [Penaeus monodon]|uniref:2-oxoglutarate and iron-dependent oxygenase domain-containing protein 2-like n=1 Tax=Penaeus monodon TaxID=6687 RepID=UPI0018A76FF6|nr:2-oxoglutarate and iron-dependent oxygenase domain-containing protein 2-like [Penaeus monodon]
MTVQYGFCKCFFTKNFFIRKYGIHVTFLNKTQFLEDFSKILKSKGCSDPETLVPELEKEVERRRHAHEERWKHCQYVAREYKCLHPGPFPL